MAMPDEYKELQRRFNEVRQEWQFLETSHGRLTTEYGYIPTNPLERIQLHNKIVQSYEDLLNKLEEYKSEIDRMSTFEEERIELENKTYELE